MELIPSLTFQRCESTISCHLLKSGWLHFQSQGEKIPDAGKKESSINPKLRPNHIAWVCISIEKYSCLVYRNNAFQHTQDYRRTKKKLSLDFFHLPKKIKTIFREKHILEPNSKYHLEMWYGLMPKYMLKPCLVIKRQSNPSHGDTHRYVHIGSKGAPEVCKLVYF